MTTTSEVLVVDDDRRLRELLRDFLTREGFRVTTAANAKEARDYIQQSPFDIAVVDIMMPGEDGISLTQSLKENHTLPILMLTSQNEPEDRIRGLESGADDYLAKPFEPRELLLRISNLVARQSNSSNKRYIVSFGDFSFLPVTNELKQENSIISLTSTEAMLLSLFARSLNAPLSREVLSRQLNGISERSIDVQITRLRRKIEANPQQPQFLRTIRGKGYALYGERIAP